MRPQDAGRGALAAIVLGCTLGKDEAVAETTASCTEQLVSLREEMQWADGSRQSYGELASVPEWRRSAAPAHVVSLRFGELRVDDVEVSMIGVGSIDEDVAETLREFPDSDARAVRLDEERALEWKLEATLKKALAPLAGQSVALAIDASIRWEIVAPTLRVLSRRQGVVPLLVGMPFPPWWNSRLFEEASKDASGLAEVAHAFALRSAEVFATCPTAVTFSAESPDIMVSYVDGIEACNCRVDLAASRELLHGIATPMVATVGVVELSLVRSGDGTAFAAEPAATWSVVLPRLLAASSPVVLPDLPPPREYFPPPPPPPERRKRRR